MENKLNRTVHLGIIIIFVSLYFLVATISMINSVAFFDLAHEGLMNWALAIGFELGAAASLAAIIILDRTNKTMVWGLFLLLTAFQMMANSFHAFINLEDYMGWIELFGLEEAEPLYQKRILSIVSGAILPLVALGFIKSLIDYVRPNKEVTEEDYFEGRNKHIEEITVDGGEVEVTVEPTEEQIKDLEEDTVIEDNMIMDMVGEPEEDVVEPEPEPIKEEVIEDDTKISLHDLEDMSMIGEPKEVVEPESEPTPIKLVEVSVAPLTIETDNAAADVVVEEPIPKPAKNVPKKAPLTSRPFIRSGKSKP